MTTPTPIAFEPAAKPAPSRRDNGAGGADQSFADTMQAQRAADRSSGAANPAAERAGSAHAQGKAGSEARSGASNGDRPTATASGERGGSAQAGQAGKAAASAQPTGKAEQTAAQGAARTAEQAAGKATAAEAAQAASKAAAAKAAQAAGSGAAQARGTTIDGQPVKAALQDARSAQTRPINAATAVAAHSASASAAASGKPGADGKAGDPSDATASKTKPAANGASKGDDPTAKALKEAFASPREAGAGRRGDDAGAPNAQRTDARPAGERPAGTGMSPALRAAAEAVQQQLTGSSAGSAGSHSSGTGQAGLQSTQQALRADGSAAPAAGSGQTFDPVLQNTGPQPGGAGQPGSLAAAGKAAPTAGTGAGNPAPSTPPAEQVAVQIQRAAAQGQSRVQIRLNPAELGRIDVKLEVGDDGHVRAALAVDKPETLDLMQRDPRALERALQAAGLKTDQGSLSFNLRDDGTGQGRQGTGDGGDRPGANSGGTAGAPDGDAPIPAEQLRASLPADGRVDIRV